MANTPDVYEENCAWITCAGKGYITYYFEKRGMKLPCNVYELYTESNVTNTITKCVDEGKSVKSIHANLDDLQKYDKLYICQIHKKIENI